MSHAPPWPSGGGETGALIRARDWSRTPLGPVEGWPASLRTAVDIMLASPGPVSVMWGPDLVQLYNDAYVVIAQERHPAIFGRPALESWADARAFLGPILEGVLAGGPAAVVRDHRVPLRGSASAVEERSFTATFSAIRDESGAVGGIFHPLEETTATARAEAALGATQAEARRLETARDKQRQVFDTVLAHLQEFVYLFDLEGRFRYVNRPLLDLWGLRLEEAVGKDFFDLGYPDALARQHGAEVRRVIETREAIHGESAYTSPAGETGHYEYSFVPLLAPDGSVEAVGGHTRVVTERRRAEAALRESEEKYRTLFESMDEGFCILRMIFDEEGRPADYRYEEINPAFVQQTGFRDALGRTIRELVPDIEPFWVDVYGKVALTGEPTRFVDHAASMGRWFDVYAFRVGEPGEGRVAVLFTDITGRKQGEAALRASEERFRLMADAVPQIVWITDAEGRAEFFNRQWTAYTGRPFEPITAAEVAAAAVHPDDAGLTIARFEEARAGGGTFQVEHRIRSAAGTYRWFLVRGEPYREPESGRIVAWFGASIDIHDRKEAEEALRESEDRLRMALQAADMGIWEHDLRAERFHLDPRARALYALDPVASVDALVGRVHPDDQERLAGEFAASLDPGVRAPVATEYRVVHPDGAVVWLRVRGRVYFAGSGPADPPVRGLGTVQDVTEEKEAQTERERLLAALEVERTRLVEVIRQAPAFMVVLRGPGHVLELVNDAYQQLIGRRDVVGRPLFEAVPEARGQGFEELLDRVLETGEPFTGRGLPVRLERTPGAPPEERLIDLAYVPLTEADGTRTGVVVLGTDVTEQVRARREIERARDRAERLQALTAALAGARTLDEVATVVVADMVVALGARTGALAGVAPEGDALVLLRTIGFSEPVAAGVRRQALGFRSPLAECFQTRSPVWIERREGEEGLDARFPPIAPVWEALGVHSAAFVPLVVAGEAVGVISFSFDAPRAFAPEERAFLLALGQQAAIAVERARLFEAEHAARAEAERANRAKSEFLAVMSHELRTPLNAIGGYTELMEMGIRGPVTAQQRGDLHRIQQSQRHLLGLINEVLNYAKLESGAVRFDLEDVRVAEALTAATALVAPQAGARGLVLEVAPCPPALSVRADGDKLRQVLLNLLSNAVKFTDPGGRVELRCEEEEGRVRIVVRDTGIGIPDDQLGRIFEPFVQVRADLTRTAEGTGLGLAISRDLARGMGGDLTARSIVGEGSTFTLTLPRSGGG